MRPERGEDAWPVGKSVFDLTTFPPYAIWGFFLFLFLVAGSYNESSSILYTDFVLMCFNVFFFSFLFLRVDVGQLHASQPTRE